jgi:hypothetical protein
MSSIDYSIVQGERRRPRGARISSMNFGGAMR